MKVWFDNVTHRDAKLLARWWNRHRGSYYNQYRAVRSQTNKRQWAVVRHD